MTKFSNTNIQMQLRNDTLFSGPMARRRLIDGIRKCAEAVGSTMGTAGGNGLIEAIENPGHLMTNDGATILGAIHLADPMEEMGRRILLEAVSRANKASGDGSSTTAVLTHAILEEGTKKSGRGTPMEIKRSLEKAYPAIEKAVKGNSKKIGVSDVGAVATISAEDSEIGARIQEIYEKIGEEGIINWDISKTSEDSYTIGTGITVDGATYYSPYMCDSDESGRNTRQVRLKKPHVILTKQKISSSQDLNGIFSTLFASNLKDVVIFCDEVDPLIVPNLIQTRLERGFRAVLVKMPTLWKDWWYEDLALASGAKIADPVVGLPLKNLTMEDVGEFGSILITQHDTYIDGILMDLAPHIQALKDQKTEEGDLRAARLNTKTARYFVGAQSDSALSYRRLKVEDAISASWQALHGGVVAGGGVSLLNAHVWLDLQSIGGEILAVALQAPFRQIIRNAGLPEEDNIKMCLVKEPNTGINTQSLEMVDMVKANIVDPTTVVLNAVKNAISVAATVLTANTVVLLPRTDDTSGAVLSPFVMPQ